jgi:alpha-L-rhamnosidase
MRDPTVVVDRLWTDDESSLVATGSDEPRLSWKLTTERIGARQIGYEVEVGLGPNLANSVKSGCIMSPRVAFNPWPAPALCSRDIRYWRVQVMTDLGLTDWSKPACIEAALLSVDDWTARPIALPSDIGRKDAGPVPLFRREFSLRAGFLYARLYVTALGVHDLQINGRPVSDDLLEPGWTSYRHRLLYSTYDVAHLLIEGRNTISAAVGDGWYRGKLTWTARRNVYGDAGGLLAQLEVEHEDRSRITVGTDAQWRASTGALRSADLYDGVDVDLRREPKGWRLNGFDDDSWEAVAELPIPARLDQRAMPPVRTVATLRPHLMRNLDGLVRVDTGQNLVGYLRLEVRGAAGGRVTLRHAEVLDAEGRLHTTVLRKARATDNYILGAESPVVLEPKFTFHGFRYAEIETTPGVSVESVEVVVLSSDLTQTGDFECSEPLLNQLFKNVWWSQRGNFLAIPTDCPQRDERLGWTGDIQVFAPTACGNADSRAFLASWLVDLAYDQRPDGAVPSVVPDVLQGDGHEYGSAGWGDAATGVPWSLYEAYGDLDLLRRQYPSMKAWVDWAASRRGQDGTWTGDVHFGDWLDPGAPPGNPAQAKTNSDFIATAYLSHSAGIVARTAHLVSAVEDVQTYTELRESTASAAWRRWADDALTTQTGCAIALELGIAPPNQRPRVGDALAELVRLSGGRIATGFLGTPLVLPALAGTGHLDEAYQLLLNRDCPGWLYQVLMGATTMWERWDAILPGGTIHSGEMSVGEGANMLSFNHYAYGAVAAWLYRSVAGIGPDADDPGYSTIVFAPLPGGGLSRARARLETPYGLASISWKLAANELEVDLVIPPGARGRFAAPPGWVGNSESELTSGSHRVVLTGGGRD